MAEYRSILVFLLAAGLGLLYRLFLGVCVSRRAARTRRGRQLLLVWGFGLLILTQALLLYLFLGWAGFGSAFWVALIAAVLADLIALFGCLLAEAARARRHLTEQQKIDLYNS